MKKYLPFFTSMILFSITYSYAENYDALREKAEEYCKEGIELACDNLGSKADIKKYKTLSDEILPGYYKLSDCCGKPDFLKRYIDIEINNKIPKEDIKKLIYKIYSENKDVQLFSFKVFLKNRSARDLPYFIGGYNETKGAIPYKEWEYIENDQHSDIVKQLNELQEAKDQKNEKTLNNMSSSKRQKIQKIENEYGNKFTIVSTDDTKIKEFIDCYKGYLNNNLQDAFDLAEFYYQDGNVIKSDIDKAMNIYEKIFKISAEENRINLDRKINSALAMANIYLNGQKHIKKDMTKSFDWYYKAAQMEFKNSLKGFQLTPASEERGMDWGLLRLYEEIKYGKNKQTLPYLQKLVSENNFHAMYQLAILYKDNHISEPNSQKIANDLFKRASTLGHKPSCQELTSDWSRCE